MQDGAVNKGPHELPFVLEVPAEGLVVERVGELDLYRPADAAKPLPAVVFVHGPVPAEAVRPLDWPSYQGYGRLAATRGLVGVTIDLDYPHPMAWPAAAEALGKVVDMIRSRPEVDGDRMALWAFSGGGLVVGRWLGDAPDWLRCIALSYPYVNTSPSDGEVLDPTLPVVLTRVGRERPEVQATVDAFMAIAATVDAAVEVIDVPEGQHGFDVLDPGPRSREALVEAMDAVQRHLRP